MAVLDRFEVRIGQVWSLVEEFTEMKSKKNSKNIAHSIWHEFEVRNDYKQSLKSSESKR